MKRLIVVGVFLVSVVGLSLGWGFVSEVGAKITAYFTDDPDLPPGMTGELDEADYIRRRDEFIALLRGVDPDRPADPESRTRAINMMDDQKVAMLRATRKGARKDLAFLTAAWTELGPNPIPLGQTSGGRVAVSGRVTAIEIDPTDPNKVYVGTAQGGVFRSLDGGTTWVPIFDGAQSLAIGTLNLDPANGWLWVGTGEPNGSGDSFSGAGLYRIESVNTIATLVGPINPIRNYNNSVGTPVSSGFFTGRSVSKIVRVPGDPSTLFVGIAGGVIGLGGNPPFGNTLPPLAIRGMVRLSNVTGPPAGITGTRLAVSTVDTGQGLCAFDLPCTVNRNVNDLVLDPQDPSGNKLIVWLNGINAAGDGGIYRSTNAMAASPTFTQTLVTTSTTTGNARGELRAYVRGGVTEVYVASGEPSNVPAGATLCNNSTQFGALCRSDDGGATWSAKLAGGGGFCDGQCFYNIGFDVVPGAATTSDKLLLGGNVSSGACQRQQATSLDGGATAFISHTTNTHADTHVIKVAPSDPTIVYRGDDGGIWKSTDGGDTWTTLNNTTMRATQFQSIALHPTDPNISVGGTQDNGSELLQSDGTTWLHSDDGDGGFAMIDQSTPTTMYHTYFNQTNSQIGFVRSTDGGSSWTFSAVCANGISCADSTNFYAPMALGPGNPSTVYFGSDRLYRSSTSGTANVVVSQAPIQAGVPVSSIAVSPLDDNYRIVGLNNGAIWFTTTGSSTLTLLDQGGATPPARNGTIPDFYVARVAFDPNNKSTAYIALGNYGGDTLPANSHVWKVTNLSTGPVITSLNGTGANVLPDVPVNGFVVDPLDSASLYAGTDIGVYTSTDSGVNWIPFGTGLPRVPVFDMAIQSVFRILRIATHGRGMWQTTIPGVGLPLLRSGGNGSSGPGGASAIVTESCPDAAIDPGETVTVSYAIQNFGGGPTNNLTATLQANGGVTAPSGPQNYGAVAAGATVSRNFTFTAVGSCGSDIILNFHLQDGATDYGVFSVTYTLGALVVTPSFSENFDGVGAPALPAGWTTARTGAAPFWASTTSFSDTAPNSTATDFALTPSDNSLTTPTIAIPTAPGTGTDPHVELNFRNNYNLESTFDGGVLEISINGSAFTDIAIAGGVFTAGGYSGMIGTAESVLNGRAAWTGNSNGFITTTVRLPAASYGQNVQLRWRTAYDTDTPNPTGNGMRVDTVSISAVTRVCCTASSNVSVGGQVLTPDGHGVRNTLVSIRDPQNVLLARVTTNSFGFFNFEGVPTGFTYTITVNSKLYHYTSQHVTVNGAISNLVFVGLE